MKQVALCIYSDNSNHNHVNTTVNGIDCEIFSCYNDNLLQALKNVSINKRHFEIENLHKFDICIAYNPKNANINDINISYIRDNTIFYAYGNVSTGRYRVGANPSLFYSHSIEFNRACEFIDNLNNIRPFDPLSLDEKFIFHLRSLFLKDECVNYENSSLFIRTA